MSTTTDTRPIQTAEITLAGFARLITSLTDVPGTYTFGFLSAVRMMMAAPELLAAWYQTLQAESGTDTAQSRELDEFTCRGFAEIWEMVKAHQAESCQ